MAPLKPGQPGAKDREELHFHAYRSVAPLKLATEDPNKVPDGGISTLTEAWPHGSASRARQYADAYRISTLTEAWPHGSAMIAVLMPEWWGNFHAYRSVAPLKLLNGDIVDVYQMYFHAYRSVAPLKLDNLEQMIPMIQSISTLTEAWPHGSSNMIVR